MKDAAINGLSDKNMVVVHITGSNLNRVLNAKTKVGISQEFTKENTAKGKLLEEIYYELLPIQHE